MHKGKTYIDVVLILTEAEGTPVPPETAGTPLALGTADCATGMADDPEPAINGGLDEEATGVTATGLKGTPVGAEGVPLPNEVVATLDVSAKETAAGVVKPTSDIVP